MPPIEVFGLHQSAVYWAAEGVNESGLQTVSADPEELKVRWISQQRNGTSPKGDPITTDVTVIAAQQLLMGSVLWEGYLDDIPGTTDIPESGLYLVVTETKGLDIKGRRNRWEYGLQRLHGSLPLS